MQLVEKFTYEGIHSWVFTWSNPAMRCVYICDVFTASVNHFQSHRRNYFGMLCAEGYLSMVIISCSCSLEIIPFFRYRPLVFVPVIGRVECLLMVPSPDVQIWKLCCMPGCDAD